MLQMIFLSHVLTTMLVYVWSRNNPSVMLNILGLITVHAPYLPWVFFAISYILGNNATMDFVGRRVAFQFNLFVRRHCDWASVLRAGGRLPQPAQWLPHPPHARVPVSIILSLLPPYYCFLRWWLCLGGTYWTDATLTLPISRYPRSDQVDLSGTHNRIERCAYHHFHLLLPRGVFC